MAVRDPVTPNFSPSKQIFEVRTYEATPFNTTVPWQERAAVRPTRQAAEPTGHKLLSKLLLAGAPPPSGAVASGRSIGLLPSGALQFWAYPELRWLLFRPHRI